MDEIAKLQNAIYEGYAEPKEFFDISSRLEAAAMTLRQHHPISEDSNKALDDRSQEFMLWGFCIENLMKGLFAKRKKQEGGSITKQNSEGHTEYAGSTTHNLNKIADQISFPLSEKERLALTFFSKAIVYFGRYPLPLSSKHLAIYWEDDFDVVLRTLLVRLKEQTNAL